METPGKTEEIPSIRTQRLIFATAIGVAAGSFYEVVKESVASAIKDAELLLKLKLNPDRRDVVRQMGYAMLKSSIRIHHALFVGGARLGMFSAGFYGLQNLLAEKRGVHDVFNVIGAGSATFAAYGLIMSGSLQWRARNMVLGSVMGAAVGSPLGGVISVSKIGLQIFRQVIQSLGDVTIETRGWIYWEIAEKVKELQEQGVVLGQPLSGLKKT